MGNKKVTMMKLLVLLLVFSIAISMVMGYKGEGGRRREGRGEGYDERERGEEGYDERGGGEEEEEEEVSSKEMFMLQNSKQVIKTEAGEVRVVRGWNKQAGRAAACQGVANQNPMHIGFITMEPKSLFIPQYIDSSLIIFIRRGEARIGWIHEDGLAEKQLKHGDIYRIPAGSTFYIVNTGKGQRLQIIASIDTTESLGRGVFQSFFIAGGTNPQSVLAGFDHRTLTTAFNVSSSQLEDMMTRQEGGPIIYIQEGGRGPDEHEGGSFMNLKQQMNNIREEDDDDEEEERSSSWSWRKLMMSMWGKKKKGGKGSKRTVSSPDSYNLYDRKPDFQNNYGWSLALDEHDYTPLSHSGVGVYLVNLTAGSMMAPHVNPTATEYGVVLRGAGSIQVVYPNGTLAMNTRVEEGDVFWIPRYFPFCQIASRSGPMEFFGFTTSARKNRPQFLVGASSVLQTMRGPELATAFGMTEERFRSLINAQRESVILPSAPVSEPNNLRYHEKDMVAKI